MNTIANIVRVEVHHDLKTSVWHAKIIHTEERRGKQYGGAAVQEIASKPDTGYDEFMQAIRQQVKKDLDIYWT